LICLVFALGLAPVIPWVEFSGGMENFNVATALESQRDDHWLMPYLGLEPRSQKPPLVHWITAAGIKLLPQSLAWGSRGASIAVSCATLVAVYELGTALEDGLLGLVGAFVCGTTILFLKFAWQASYDLHLALWVTAASACLAMATFRGRRWSGFCGAGIALGLALMTKGPVAILQTVIPWAAFLGWRKWVWKEATTLENSPSPCTQGEGRGGGSSLSNAAPRASWTFPLIAGFALSLLISLPWTLYAMWVNRRMLGVIYNEVTLGTESSYETRVRWHSYIVFFPMMLPWLIWFFTGFVEIARNAWREKSSSTVAGRLWLAIFWLVLPIAVMTFFPERRDRYLLPMIGPAALLAAYGVLRHVPRWGRWTPFQRTLVITHGIAIAAIAIGLPIYGATKLQTVDGLPWYGAPIATAAAGAAIVILIAGVLAYRKTRVGFVAATVALMVLANIVFMWGYKDSSSGRSEGKVFAADILSSYPQAQVYNASPKVRKFLPLELLIYLNRDVPTLDDPAKLTPSAQPQVLIYAPAEDGAAAPAAPPGFREIAQRKINTGVYRAFVREAR
jgi:4-amino-4-deoxy-L-arabinose transferase-like glycosyltransferase